MLALVAVLLAAASDPAATAILPPEPPWTGASRALVRPADDPWVTPAEASGFRTTPRYDETVAWLKRLDEASEQIQLSSYGRSPEGRELWLVVASADGARTPEELHRSGKPVMLAHAGIHAGEIDGKDAGLMLLRDLTVGGRLKEVLQRASLVFIPMLNPDGHERFTAFTRINQRGPQEAGWRTNATNLNLNRDFAKLDTTEVRAVVKAVQAWEPDLYLDLHVTDGGDHQYDVTYGDAGDSGWSPAIHHWMEDVLRPAVDRDLAAKGHVGGPLNVANLVDNLHPENGVVDWIGPPRFSTSWGDGRHVPSLLLENHALKPYARRVLGTYVFLESLLRLLPKEVARLRAAVARDRALPVAAVALDFAAPTAASKPVGRLAWKGIGWVVEDSPVSGAPRLRWTGEPVSREVPVFTFAPSASTTLPRAYWVPAAWTDVIARLELHGIRMERLDAEREVEVDAYRLGPPQLQPPFEGRVPVKAPATLERRRERLPAGTVRVPTDQPLGILAALLLEPASPDSFFQWGFFLSAQARTEYAEGYILEPMARAMLEADPALKAEFEAKLAADESFAKDAEARLDWFYRRTRFFDQRFELYPVLREP